MQLIRYPVLVLNKVFTGVTGGDGDLLADAPGDQLNYTFVLANAGNVTLTDVSLMDAKTGIALTGITLDPGMVQTRFGSYTLTQADIDQNGDGKLIAAPFCVRPFPTAPVSMTLEWSEVKPGLSPRQFTVRDAVARLKRVGDPMAPVLTLRPDLGAALAKLG